MTATKAEQHLAELRKIATATLKAANVAARHEGLVLVDAAKLERLEALYEAVAIAFSGAYMTREYGLQDGDQYNGKRFVVGRTEAERVYGKLYALGFSDGPPGCLARGFEQAESEGLR